MVNKQLIRLKVRFDMNSLGKLKKTEELLEEIKIAAPNMGRTTLDRIEEELGRVYHLVVADERIVRNLSYDNLDSKKVKLEQAEERLDIWELKELANQRDIPYQALLKHLLAERVEEELRKRRPAA